MLRQQIRVRPVAEQDRNRLANLIHFEMMVHRHLDWRPPLEWLGHTPYLVAERGSRLLSALVCPPDPPEVAWIRLFAVSSEITEEDAWEVLWPAAQEALVQGGDTEVYAIPLQQWFRNLLEHSGFVHSHDVVMLSWDRGRRLPEPRCAAVEIRAMRQEDLASVCDVDSSAFGPVWRNSSESLMIAFQQAAIATVVENDSGLIAYQISTPTPMGGHLARLAVRPQYQGHGVGYVLLKDLLARFEQRGALRVTVNTQKDNDVSLKLYAKAGFQRLGEEYPVYRFGACCP